MAAKKLYLDKANKKIAGVCAGVAEYLDVDMTVVRIVFLVALLCASFGLWPYLVIWALAPAKGE